LAAAQAAAPKPLGGFTARLEDRVETLPEERVRWSTDWVLCWKAPPKAVAYEVQVSTSEGYSRNAKRIETTCHRVEVAKDEGPRSAMADTRARQLTMISTMVGYRVRAVHADGSATPWSDVFPAAQSFGKPAKTKR
jgi:hypothetical protein